MRTLVSHASFAAAEIALAATAIRYSISVIVSRSLPAGVSTCTESPLRLPTRALPTGETLEMRPAIGSVSTELTMVYLASRPDGSRTVTG